MMTQLRSIVILSSVAGALMSWSAPARATDFSVLELHGAYELHRTSGGHGSYGFGYTFDTLITTETLRGIELGARADLLHCPACTHAVDGGALVGSALATLWKDDLSAVTFYLGLAPGLGYSRATDVIFGELEVQAALQFRAIYDGWWVRPVLYAGAGGAYGGYTSLGLRVAIGYSPNHGQRQADMPSTPQDPGQCDPPERAELSAGAQEWVLPGCFRSDVSVRLDGAVIEISDRQGSLVMQVGQTAGGVTQHLDLNVAGGSFSIDLTRR